VIVDAFWLPGFEAGDVAAWETRELGDVVLRWPVLRPDSLRRAIGTIGEQRRFLARLPVSDIVRAIDAAAARLADPHDPLRSAAEAALPAVTGYSPEMVRLVLGRMIPDWRRPALEQLLRSELGDPAVLDGFVADRRDPGQHGTPRRLHASGPALAFHVFAGNVPGVAVTSLVRSLLLKSATLGKTAAGEPVLAPLFAQALAQVAPEIAGAIAIAHWPGGALELEDAALAAADAVVVYGGEETLAALAPRVRPGARLLDHGPRYSFGIVGRAALTRAGASAVAGSVARAVAPFDQQGCVSPHVVYVERGGEVDPAELAEMIGGALAGIGRELPRGRISPAEAAAVHQARGAAEFRAIAGEDVVLHPQAVGSSFTVAYDADPAFAPSCLNRFLWVKPIDDLLQAVECVRPYAAYLQTVAVAGAGERLDGLALALAAAGATRVTTFTDAPWPPPDWHHDGRGPLVELVRWTDLVTPP